MHLGFTVGRGLFELNEPEIAWQEKEEYKVYLKRLGYEPHYTRAGHVHGTSYDIYQRVGRFPFLFEFSNGTEVVNIFCESIIDQIACRAYLAPIVMAENSTVLDLDGSVSGLVDRDKQGNVLGLYRRSELIQLITQLVNDFS